MNKTQAIKHVALVPNRYKINLGEYFCKWFQFLGRRISLLKDTFFCIYKYLSLFTVVRKVINLLGTLLIGGGVGSF